MPRGTRLKTESNRRETEIRSLLKKIDRDPENVYTASIDDTLGIDKGGIIRFFVFSDDFRHVGICRGDAVVIDTNIQQTPERNALIASVVTQDRDWDEYLDFDFEEDHGAADILDVEYIYPEEAEGPKRRRKKGDSPQIKRVVLGVVTWVIRPAKNLREEGGKEEKL